MREQTILVTGSAGLIGKAITRHFSKSGCRVVEFDWRNPSATTCQDVRNDMLVATAIQEATGVIHLAAVSRVVSGEQNPALCWSINVDGTRCVLNSALASRSRPWVIYASSREVYGQQTRLPVPESAASQPLNVYARTKVESEKLMDAARSAGLRTAIVRFSNVYGDVRDYKDRVIPAFAAASKTGGQLRGEGPNNVFDFTHVDDVVDGVARLCDLLGAGESAMPPLHFVSGIGTKLCELAAMAIEAGASGAVAVEEPPRTFDVSYFRGDPSRAATILGWHSTTSLRDGLIGLISDLHGGAVDVRNGGTLPIGLHSNAVRQ